MSNTYWAIKRRERAAAEAPPVVEPEPEPEPVAADVPTAATATKAELIAAAEEAGIELDGDETKAEIAAKLAEG